MNRRGELERAIARARVTTSFAAFYAQLLRRAGNDDGEIPQTFAPTLTRLAADAKISRATLYRCLAEAKRHGWFARDGTGDVRRVSGRLAVGEDCDCAPHFVTACQRPGCGKPVISLRRHARYCSDRCRKAVNRLRNPDMQSHSERTTVSASRDKPQVAPRFPQEAARREGGKRLVERKPERSCSRCGAQPAGRGGILCSGCERDLSAVGSPEWWVMTDAQRWKFVVEIYDREC